LDDLAYLSKIRNEVATLTILTICTFISFNERGFRVLTLMKIPPDLEEALSTLRKAKIDVENRLRDIARIGEDPKGGITRLAYSSEENKAFEYVKDVGISYGLVVKEDPLGNLYLELPGQTKESVIIGSHLDTVPRGGMFDGTVGVVCSLEIAKALSQVELKKKLVVAAFRAEESARFKISLIGSSIATGRLDPSMLEVKDSRGIKLREAIEACGFYPDRLKEAKLCLDKVRAYLEYHIEQGPVLEAYECPVGVVTAIAGPSRYELSFKGEWAHSGTTPMDMRKDALVTAAEIVLSVKDVCIRKGSVVGTVGDLRIPGGSINKVPGEAVLYLEVRSVEDEERREVLQEILKIAEERAMKNGVSLNIRKIEEKSAVKLSRQIVNVLEFACDSVGVGYLLMPSGASHDAVNFCKAGIPTGMLFCQSKGGISHSPEEFSQLDHIMAGAEVLLAGTYMLCSGNVFSGNQD